MRFAVSGVSFRIPGVPGSPRVYLRACPKPCGSRRPCEHRGQPDPWAHYLRTHGHEEQAAKWEGRETR
jgi:hypothetical protein